MRLHEEGYGKSLLQVLSSYILWWDHTRDIAHRPMSNLAGNIDTSQYLSPPLTARLDAWTAISTSAQTIIITLAEYSRVC
jgi:hypothetical protein